MYTLSLLLLTLFSLYIGVFAFLPLGRFFPAKYESRAGTGPVYSGLRGCFWLRPCCCCGGSSTGSPRRNLKRAALLLFLILGLGQLLFSRRYPAGAAL